MPQPPAPPDAKRLLALVDRMVGRNVLVVADLVADRFITGSPKRISREAPVLILRHEGETSSPGGGANAAANVASLGGAARVVSAVGDDELGRALLADLDRRGVNVEAVAQRKDFRTPSKTRVLGGSFHGIKQQIVRYDVEDELQTTPRDLDRLGEVVAAHRDAIDAAIISDYGYGAALPAMAEVVRDALPNETPILCDSRYRLGEFRGMTAATPNEEEAIALLGRPLGETAADVATSGETLRKQLSLPHLLITRGSAGMSLLDETGALHLPVHGTDQVADVTGAGDTVIGTFALALAGGGTPAEAALLANYGGGVVVMKSGTATLTRPELEDAIRSNPDLAGQATWTPHG